MNGKRNLRTMWVVPLVAFLVLAALPARPAAAQLGAGGNLEIATMAIYGGNVSFTPKISFEEMTLSVAGQGHFSTLSVRSGQTASFTPVDSEGLQLPDGTYNWELAISPRPQDLDPRAFKNGKVSADGRSVEAAKAPQGQRQSGVFTIKNGFMVDPDLVEAGPVRGGPIRGTDMGATGAVAPPSAAARAAEHRDQDDS